MSFPYYIRSAAELEIGHALDYYALNVPRKLADLEQAIADQVWHAWSEEHEVVEEIAFLHGRQSRAVLRERD